MTNEPSSSEKTEVHFRCSSSMADTMTPAIPLPEASTIAPDSDLPLVSFALAITGSKLTVQKQKTMKGWVIEDLHSDQGQWLSGCCS